ncbi:MAG: ABC transporter ATP-binding protein [Jatrophihabitans sp.]
MAVLETRGISVRFGGLTANDDVSIDIEGGAITGLIGPNGAGKTTLFNVMTGLQKPTNGGVFFDGQDITGISPSRRAQRGLGRTFQRLELFLSLSVRDNIRAAGDVYNANHRGNRVKVNAVTDQVLGLTGLEDIADQDVADIPTGRARVVEVARALVGQPRVLLLDEPASGQTEHETEVFTDLLKRLVAEGLTICLVEHDLPLVMAVCSRIHVLDFGVLLASGTPAEIQANQQVIDAYIGTAEATK